MHYPNAEDKKPRLVRGPARFRKGEPETRRGPARSNCEPLVPSACRRPPIGLGGRAPSDQGVLQVVPVPEVRMKLGVSTGLIKEFRSFKDLLDKQQRAPDFQTFMDEVRAPSASKPPSTTSSLAFSGLKILNGTRELTATVERSCRIAHPIRLGPRVLRLDAQGRAAVVLGAPNREADADAQPQTHTLSTHDCAGEPSGVELQVFPSQQTIGSLTFSTQTPFLSRFNDGLNTLLRVAGDAKVEWGINGGIDTFVGWREANDWRVYYARDFGARVGISAGLSLSMSLVQLITNVPRSLLKYVGDIVASVGLAGSVNVAGKLSLRHFHTCLPGEPVMQVNTDLEVSGRLQLQLKIEAHLGAKNTLAVKFTGSVTPAINAKGKPRFDRGSVRLLVSATVEKCDLVLTLQTVAGVWEAETEWRWRLWDERPVVAAQPVQVWPWE